MEILIANEQKAIKLNIKKIKTFVKRISKILRLSSGNSLSITFLSMAKIRQLNRRYFRRDRVTDVIAFGYRETLNPACIKKTNWIGKNKRINKRKYPASWRKKGLYQDYLGDIVICPSVVLENSKIYHNDFFKELTLCVIHGLLHLQGYSETTEAQGLKMQKIQAEVLRRLNFWGQVPFIKASPTGPVPTIEKRP